jgi:hypothetical protein
MASLLLSGASLSPNATDNTTCRATGTAYSNAFANAGWIQATGVGTQINWGTVTANGTAGSNLGYEIWHMNDTLQNTAPIFLKIEYGCPTGGSFGGWITIGQGADSGGNITGFSLPRYPFGGMGFSPWAPTPVFFSGNSNRLAIGWSYPGVSSNTGSYVWSIERTHDNYGNDTADGFYFQEIGSFNTSYCTQRYVSFSAGPGPAEGTTGVFMPAASQSGLGPKFLWYPIWFNNGGMYLPAPSLMLTCGWSAQFAVHVPVTLTHFGQPHTYLPLYCYGQTNRSGQTASATRAMMLWE